MMTEYWLNLIWSVHRKTCHSSASLCKNIFIKIWKSANPKRNKDDCRIQEDGRSEIREDDLRITWREEKRKYCRSEQKWIYVVVIYPKHDWDSSRNACKMQLLPTEVRHFRQSASVSIRSRLLIFVSFADDTAEGLRPFNLKRVFVIRQLSGQTLMKIFSQCAQSIDKYVVVFSKCTELSLIAIICSVSTKRASHEIKILKKSIFL